MRTAPCSLTIRSFTAAIVKPQSLATENGYFTLSVPGQINVRPDGSNRFEPRPDGMQRYLIMNDEQRPRALEAMTLLAGEPPVANTSPRRR